MIEHFELKQWTSGGILLLALAAGCVESGSESATEGTGGAQPGSGGATGSGGTTGDNGGVVGPLDPPPAPPTSDVPQPSGAVSTPNLRVLPWAGFKAAVSYTFDDTQPSQTEHWPELGDDRSAHDLFRQSVGQLASGIRCRLDGGRGRGQRDWQPHLEPLPSEPRDRTARRSAPPEEEIDNATTYIIDRTSA